MKSLSGPEIEKMKKNVVRIFKECGLNVTIEASLHTVNYLEVTFDLRKNTFLPYRFIGVHKQLFKLSVNSYQTNSEIAHQMKKFLKKINQLTVML